MKITYGRTAYVLEVSAEMLDGLSNCMNGFADGNYNFCTTMDDIDNQIQEWEPEAMDEQHKKVQAFLSEVVSKITGNVGDVIFSR